MRERITQKEKDEIITLIDDIGFRGTLLKLTSEHKDEETGKVVNSELKPITIKVKEGYLKLIEAAKDKGYTKHVFSTPPNTTDFIRKAIDGLMDKILSEELEI